MGEALQGLRDALLSAVVGAEMSAMVSAISVADAHDGAHTWTFMLRSASRWRCGPRRAPRGRWRHPISAWEIVMRELCRPAVTFCNGRPFRSVHGPSASSTT